MPTTRITEQDEATLLDLLEKYRDAYDLQHVFENMTLAELMCDLRGEHSD